jgi:hypothetical protein
MFYPTNWLSSIRWLPVRNVGTQIIPAFGVCQLTEGAEADLTMLVSVPLVSNADVFFNGLTPIGVGQGGQVTRDFPAYGAIAVPSHSTPAGTASARARPTCTRRAIRPAATDSSSSSAPTSPVSACSCHRESAQTAT